MQVSVGSGLPRFRVRRLSDRRCPPAEPDILEGMRTITTDIPVAGKTFSLSGGDPSTESYYERIRGVADEILLLFPGEEALLSLTRKIGGRRRLLARAARRGNGTPISDVLRMLGPALSRYTGNVRAHLESLPLFSMTDRILKTTEEQYHLRMLEIELVNRLHRTRFLACDRRIALLPHCLRDFRVECRSVPGDLDTVCAGCSPACFLRSVSELLRQSGVEPYIWRNAELASLFRRLEGEGSFGILGIACIPELAHGMRVCTDRGIPVVGLPLDANRCARWMGRFEDTSVNLERLSNLLHQNP